MGPCALHMLNSPLLRHWAWDVTVATTLADSYLPASSATAAAAAEAAASRKEVEYSDLPASFSFQPIAVETLGPISESAVDFVRELGRRISSMFQEERQTAYLFQRLSVTVQRYNAVILHDSFPCTRFGTLATNGIVFSL